MENLFQKYFRLEDFVSLKHKLILMNLTGQTKVFDYKEIQFQEFKEKSLIVTVPKKTCVLGHRLLVEIYNFNDKIEKSKAFTDSSEASVSFTAVITDFNEMPTVNCIEIELQQFIQTEWDDLKQSYAIKQEGLSEILTKAKGWPDGI